MKIIFNNVFIPNYNNEIWKDIKDYEGCYQISNKGRIKSLDRIVEFNDGRKRLYKGSILNPTYDKDGYLCIILSKNAIIKGFKLHRLVAEHFIPNPDNLPVVNHIDENKINNSIENLEWCSIKYNNTYNDRIKIITEKNSVPIIQYDLQDNFIKEWKSITEANKITGIASSSIISCCKGKNKKAGSFKWKYKYNKSL